MARFLVNVKDLDYCQKADFFFRVNCDCGALFSRDDAQQRIRSEPHDDRLGSQGDDVLGLSFSEMAEPQSPRQQKDPCARKHSFFLPLSLTANGSEKAKEAMEDEMGGKMRALPPISE